MQQATHAMVVVLFGDSQVFINILCKKLSHVLIYREFALAHLGLANPVQCWIMSHCIPGKIEPDSTFLLNDQAFFARSHGVGTPLCQSLNKATLLRFSKVAKTSLFLRHTQFSRVIQHILGLSWGLLLVGHACNTLAERHQGANLIRCPNHPNWLELISNV